MKKNLKLGKRPARIDHRTFRFAKYVKELPDPPVEPSWVTHVNNWPMYLNDDLGDCTIAGAAHCIEQWLLYAKASSVAPGIALPSNTQVLAAYEAVSGYVPGDPSTDNGCVMLDVLKYWRKVGIGGHKIAAFMSINPGDLRAIAQAIYLFGNIYVGVQLPISAQGRNAWTVRKGGIYTPYGQPGSWGGHCIMIPALSPITLTCVTWGMTLKMSHNFFKDYCDEAYVCLSQDWITKDNKSPSGFDVTTLQQDLAAL